MRAGMHEMHALGGITLVGRAWYLRHGGKEKIPGALWLQGRIVDPRYHPAYLPGGDPFGLH